VRRDDLQIVLSLVLHAIAPVSVVATLDDCGMCAALLRRTVDDNLKTQTHLFSISSPRTTLYYLYLPGIDRRIYL
jgi:hypothetical protein